MNPFERALAQWCRVMFWGKPAAPVAPDPKPAAPGVAPWAEPASPGLDADALGKGIIGRAQDPDLNVFSVKVRYEYTLAWDSSWKLPSTKGSWAQAIAAGNQLSAELGIGEGGGRFFELPKAKLFVIDGSMAAGDLAGYIDETIARNPVETKARLDALEKRGLQIIDVDFSFGDNEREIEIRSKALRVTIAEARLIHGYPLIALWIKPGHGGQKPGPEDAAVRMEQRFPVKTVSPGKSSYLMRGLIWVAKAKKLKDYNETWWAKLATGATGWARGFIENFTGDLGER